MITQFDVVSTRRKPAYILVHWFATFKVATHKHTNNSEVIDDYGLVAIWKIKYK